MIGLCNDNTFRDRITFELINRNYDREYVDMYNNCVCSVILQLY